MGMDPTALPLPVGVFLVPCRVGCHLPQCVAATRPYCRGARFLRALRASLKSGIEMVRCVAVEHRLGGEGA